MPTLLQIDSCLGVGSTGRITESIGALATARGWECHIAHGARYVGSSRMHSITVGTKWGEYRHALRSMLFDSHGLGSAQETRQLINRIEQIRPDIVHLHCVHGYYLNYKILFEYLNKADIPVVWTFHDFWAITGHCAHFVEANCYKWQSKCRDCPLHKRYPSSFVDCSTRNYELKKSLFSSCRNLNITAVSDWVKDCTELSYLGNKAISVIPNGIDLNTFKYRPGLESLIPKDKGFVMLGVASQWKEGKGFADYLRLSGLLKDDEVVILVGLSRQQISSLPANIIGIECLSSPIELAQLYSRADVLLSLSYAETFGMTIVEAAACGTPSIVYDNTAQKSLVTEETGEVVPTGDVSAVYDALKKMRLLGKERYAVACRTRVEKYFNKDERFMDYIRLYEKLLNNK